MMGKRQMVMWRSRATRPQCRFPRGLGRGVRVLKCGAPPPLDWTSGTLACPWSLEDVWKEVWEEVWMQAAPGQAWEVGKVGAEVWEEV